MTAFNLTATKINNSGIHILCYTCLCEQNFVIVNDFKVCNLTMKKI